MTQSGGGLAMLEKLRIIVATAVVTAAVTSAYWVISYDILGYNEATTKNVAADPETTSAPTATQNAANSGSATRVRTPAKRVKLEPIEPVRVGALAIPVIGVKPSELRDTFNDARQGGERVHDAIDIMAKLGTPIVATAPGTVEKIWESEKGGHSVYVRSPNREVVYYYAHLDGYADTLKEGQALRVGDPIGTVGFSGNADRSGPHLHLAVMVTDAQDSWSSGTAVNPYPLLTGNVAPSI